MLVCSRHFQTGRPAYEMNETHPDWAPSLHLGHTEVKAADNDRFQRRKRRRESVTAVSATATPAPRTPDVDEVAATAVLPQGSEQHMRLLHLKRLHRCQMWTPQGSISFISKGWAGRVSDKYLTEQCGILNKLLPGDLVLADRGFNTGDEVGLMCAEVKTPGFTRGRAQMDPKSVEDTQQIAHLRVHVERVIGLVRNKYSILQRTIPVSQLVPLEGEEFSFIE